MHQSVDEHRVKKRSFAFSLVYIKCFRTYSVYLSLRLPAQILYAGIHLCPLAVSRSCFGYSLSHLRTAAACLSRCIRHRRRSKAKPLRGRRGGSAAEHRFSFVVKVRSKRCHRSPIQPLSLFGLFHKPKSQLPLHRGAEKRTPFALPSTGEPRFALCSLW